MKKFDLLIKAGHLVDPGNDREGRFDVALAGGRVVEVAEEISPDRSHEIIDAQGKFVFPGLVDSHVHLTPPRRSIGFKMLALAGVTCALDCAGPIEDIFEGISRHGSGISVAVLNRLDPGRSISGPSASRQELADYLERSLAAGAFGFKLVGGHLPLSPETTIDAIELGNQAGVYVAFHCGSTKNGSDLNGFLDALTFAGENRLHICHINAYCRGLTHGTPVEETHIALEALKQNPNVISESHMALYNSCWSMLENDVPRSHVTRRCLQMGGFESSREGLLDAARSGYLRAHKITGQGVEMADPEEGPACLEMSNFDTMVSFPVNRRSTAFLTATEKDEQNRFIVTALSTDGGGIPRNFLLSHGLSLVRFDALTLSEFVHKSSFAPSQMLGLKNKGHLGLGADGDVVVVDPHSHQALMSIAGGRVIMADGVVHGSGGTIITTEYGQKSLAGKGFSCRVADLAGSLLYAHNGDSAS